MTDSRFKNIKKEGNTTYTSFKVDKMTIRKITTLE